MLNLNHEIYDLVIASMKAQLEEKINGTITIEKENDRHFRVSIFIKGYWNYHIYNVVNIDWNELSATKMANDIYRWHRSRVEEMFFKKN